MAKVTINRQAENEQGADSGINPETGKPYRKNVSKRGFIMADGSDVDRIEEADGASYTLLVPSGNKEFKELFKNEKFKLMCAIMGFHTKIGNVANTVLNDKEEPGTPDDAAAAIEDFIQQAESGVWAERSAGAPGSRIDKVALAGAVVAVAESNKRVDWMSQYDVVLRKLEENPQLVKAVRQNLDILNEYTRRVGKPAKSLDDLAGL